MLFVGHNGGAEGGGGAVLTMRSLPDSFVSLFPDELAATDCVADPLNTQHP